MVVLEKDVLPAPINIKVHGPYILVPQAPVIQGKVTPGCHPCLPER